MASCTGRSTAYSPTSGTQRSTPGSFGGGRKPAASSVIGAPATAVGGLLKIPEVLAAFEAETRRRGIDLTVSVGTALDGALALGRYVVEGGVLAARAPYLLCSAQLARKQAVILPPGS